MAPKAKKAGKKSAPPPLEMPVVSAEDLAEAKTILQAEKEMKRQRSNMSYWLEAQGLKNQYNNKSTAAKQEFLQSWFADKLASKRTELSSTCSQSHATTTITNNDFTWMSKQELINTFGAEKAQAKIDSNVLAHRPDKDTGDDGEWRREFRICRDTGGDHEMHTHESKLAATEDAQDDDHRGQVKDMLDSALVCMGGGSATAAGVATANVKLEPESEATSSSSCNLPANPHAEFLAKLKADAKKEMRAMADRILSLKEIFEATKNEKYLQSISEDTQKLIPKASKCYKAIEKIHLEGEKDEAIVLALAMQLSDVVKFFDEINDWRQRLNPKKSNKKKKV